MISGDIINSPATEHIRKEVCHEVLDALKDVRTYCDPGRSLTMHACKLSYMRYVALYNTRMLYHKK